MAESMIDHAEEAVECSACSRVIVICQGCRGGRVSSCPSCHGKRFRKLVTNNNLAPEPMKLLDHKCKFSLHGCDEMMKMDAIIDHEKRCPNRIITCPYVRCQKEVILKTLKEHTKENDCVDDWEEIEEIHCRPGDLFRWPYDFDDNQGPNRQFDPNEDKMWKLPIFYLGDQIFYIFLHYLGSKQSFYHGVIIPDDVETASKYNVRMILGPHTRAAVDRCNRRRLTYEGPVLSIEDLPDLNSSIARSKYWIVPYEDMKPFFSYGQVIFAVSVEEIDLDSDSSSSSDSD